MQELVKKFKDNVNARAGRGTAKTNFKPENGAIFVPTKTSNSDKVLLIEETQLVKRPGLLPSVQSLNSPSLNLSVVERSSLSSELQKKIKPNLNKEFGSNANGVWYDVAFVVSKDTEVTQLNNQFFEPLGSSARGVRQHPKNMRDFGQQTLMISGGLYDNIEDNASFNVKIETHKSLLSQEKIRMRHPRWGYINVAVDGPISVENKLFPGQAVAFITFNVKEIVAFTDTTQPTPTPEQKTLSFLEKLSSAYSTARDYAFATVAEFTATVNQLDRATGAINTVANDVSGLSANIVNSPSAINRLANALGRVRGTLKTILNTPAELGKAMKDVFENFKNVLSLSAKPSAYSVDSYNKNITLISSSQALLSQSSFAADNNILLSSTDPVQKASYELMTVIKHTQSAFLAVSLIDEVDFNEVQEVDVAIKQFKDVVDSLANYELFLGKDIYKNKITHKIEYITPEIIDMIDAFFVIYNDLMFKLFNERLLLSYQNETTVQKMPILQLLHCVYQGEYDLADAEAEHVFYDRLCRLNPKLYTTEPYAEGLIRY